MLASSCGGTSGRALGRSLCFGSGPAYRLGGHPESRCDFDTDADAGSFCHANRDSSPYRDSEPNTKSNPNAIAHTFPDRDAHAHPNAYSNTERDWWPCELVGR